MACPPETMRMPTGHRTIHLPSLVFTAAAAWLAFSGVASAQRARLDVYSPAELASDGFAVSRTHAMDQGSFGAQLQLDYANDPLIWETNAGATGSESAAIVSDQLVAHAVFAYGLTNWLFVHATVPVNVVMSGDDAFARRTGTTPADGFSLNDPVLGLRAHLLGKHGELFQLGANVSFTAPLARAIDDSLRYSGEDSPSVVPELLAELDAGAVAFDANVGAKIASGTSNGNLDQGSRLVYALGATVPDLGVDGLNGHLELLGTTALRDAFSREDTPLEALLGGKYFASSGLSFGLAGGLGLLRGFGAPDARVIAQLGYAPPRVTDTDFDGLNDPDDSCPLAPEDKDGFEDAEGCPDPDNDRDGFLDVDDACTDDPETVNRWKDTDGCPDTIPDTDGDGLNDLEDQCPKEPEDKDAFADEDGCPDPDNDRDGVLDVDDACINEPGVLEARGCEAPKQVTIEGDQIVILDVVHFKVASAEIEAVSFGLLDDVAKVMIEHPDIRQVRVEGHTDSRGRAAYNVKLSSRRAAEVRTYLIGKGVEAERLVSEGYGPKRPLVANASTDDEHAKNRRVEFHIMKREESAASSEENVR